MSDRTSITTASKEERAIKALARSEIYLFLARSFSYPRGPLEEYHGRAVEAMAVLGWDSPQLLARLELPPHQEVEAHYIRAFTHTMVKDRPPYETEFGKSHLFMQAHALADIGAFYRAFGVEAASGERLDHLGTELEFMYLLTYKEAYALTSGKEELAELCREGEQRFFEKHLGQWAPLFLRLLEQQVDGFYHQLAKVAANWLKAEVEELAVCPQPLGEEALATSQGSSFLSYLEEEPAPCEEQL